MKKIFTLLAGLFMTVSAVAQDEFPATVSWAAQKGVEPANKTVQLLAEDESPVITCEFLDGVVNHNGRDPQDFIWVFNQGAYAVAWDVPNNKVDGNGMEVRFTANYGGTLEIVLDAALAAGKPVNMYINDNRDITINATSGDQELVSGAEHLGVAAKTPIVYEIQKGLTYNFFCGGTKWRFKSFSFTATNNDDPDPVDTDKKIAVVSPEGEDDALYFAIQDGFESTFVGTDVTLEQLQEYEAVLVSNKVTADSPFASVLRSAVAYQPVVNLSAALVEAWGLGTVADSETNTITVSDENLENALYADLTYDEGFELVAEGTLPVVTPGAYLANDDVLATVGDKPYILVHNANRNAHILIPFAAEAATDGENMMGLVANALKVAAKSKRAVVQAAKPTFKSEQGNLETTVAISGPEGSVIRYAIGADAEVNAESAVYTEPILFKEVETIKAYTSLDGYLDSDVATYEVAISAKAERPVITVVPGEGKSAVITIAAVEEGAEIHYSFKGQSEDTRLDAAKTFTYTEPIVVNEPTVVYAFTTGANLLPSDLESMGVDIPGIDASNIRLDEVSHFSARQEWNQGASYAAYVGKNSDGVMGVGGSGYKAYSHYTDVVERTEMVEQQAKDEEGNLKVDDNGNPVMETVEKNIYKVDPDSYFELTCEEEPDWKVVTEGQQLTFENVTPEQNVLGGNGNGYETPFDLIDRAGTSKVLSFKSVGKSNGVSDPSTGRVESAKAFAAPFDVVVYIRNNKPNAASVRIQTSTDGKEWSEGIIADAGSTQRTVKRTRYSVEGEGNYFVRVIHHKGDSQVQDIFIYNNGELSKEYTGLEEVVANEGAEVISVEYFNINGMRIAEPETGFCIMRATLSNGNVVVKKVVK